jgi:uncharacterized lipoprotein YmbA
MKRRNHAGGYGEKFGTEYCRFVRLCTAGSPCGRIVPHPEAFLVSLIVCSLLTGCSFLKPVTDTSRQFVLTPLTATETADLAPGASRATVVHVKIPAYLFNSSIAVRKGANEIGYPPGTLWAERLDSGIPAVLAADLSLLLPTDRFCMWMGPSDDFATEMSVSIEQFDVSSSGQAVLIARWSILSAGEEKVLRSGESHLSRSGPAPDTDPSGAVGTLSDLIADLSRQLAQALSDTATPSDEPAHRA